MKTRGCLHIGYFKTGTTAIQQFFGRYIEEIAKIGVQIGIASTISFGYQNTVGKCYMVNSESILEKFSEICLYEKRVGLWKVI